MEIVAMTSTIAWDAVGTGAAVVAAVLGAAGVLIQLKTSKREEADRAKQISVQARAITTQSKPQPLENVYTGADNEQRPCCRVSTTVINDSSKAIDKVSLSYSSTLVRPAGFTAWSDEENDQRVRAGYDNWSPLARAPRLVGDHHDSIDPAIVKAESSRHSVTLPPIPAGETITIEAWVEPFDDAYIALRYRTDNGHSFTRLEGEEPQPLD